MAWNLSKRLTKLLMKWHIHQKNDDLCKICHIYHNMSVTSCIIVSIARHTRHLPQRSTLCSK